MTIKAKKIIFQSIVLATIIFIVPIFGFSIFQDEQLLLWLYLPIAYFILIPFLAIYLLRIKKGDFAGLNRFFRFCVYFSIIFLFLLFLSDLGLRLFILLYWPPLSGEGVLSGFMVSFKYHCSLDYLLDKEYGFWDDFKSMAHLVIYWIEIILNFIAIKINKSITTLKE